MEEVSTKTQMAKIRKFEKGFMATHLINIGAKSGIFEVLNENKDGLTASEIASKLGLHEPYIKIWCQTAYHFEILDGDEKGRFSLQPYLNEILGDKNHFRNYLANIVMDVNIIGKAMPEVTAYLKSSETIELYSSPEFSEIVYRPSNNIALVFLFMILPKNENLKALLEKGIKFLDIGCGNGMLIIQLAQSFANSHFVGINSDIHGIKSAKATIAHFGLQERVFVEHMGGENLTNKDEFDMVSMVVTLHEIPPDIRRMVVEKAYQALKKDGHLMVLDFPYPSKLEDFRNPMYDYGILDQFYEIVAGTVHLNNDEQNEMLSKSGFKNIQRVPIGKGMFDFITATK